MHKFSWFLHFIKLSNSQTVELYYPTSEFDLETVSAVLYGLICLEEGQIKLTWHNGLQRGRQECAVVVVVVVVEVAVVEVGVVVVVVVEVVVVVVVVAAVISLLLRLCFH